MPASRIDVALDKARAALEDFAAPRRQDRYVREVLEALVDAVEELAKHDGSARPVRSPRKSTARKSRRPAKPAAPVRDESDTDDEPSVLSA